MKPSVDNLRNDLERIEEILDQESLLSFSTEDRADLRSNVEQLRGKLTRVDEQLLTIGLLGGTGVGKSTVMNALAGSEIASTSHRRPHTDRVLIYRHRDAHLPAPLTSAAPKFQEHVHQADSVERILLCDLPDFDSLLGEHHRQVLTFLEHLDLLVWVSSPEKYADARFHELLHEVPKARKNYYFVLNKVDLLFQTGALEQGYGQLETVTTLFQEHLHKAGIEQPLIYPVSAASFIQNPRVATWNQFPSFKQQIFQQRDLKEIHSIKSANLDVEIQQIVDRFNQEIRGLERFLEILGETLEHLEERRSEWMAAGWNMLRAWLRQNVRATLERHLENSTQLVGLGRIVAAIAGEWNSRIGRQEPSVPTQTQFEPPPEALDFLEKQVGWVRTHLEHQLMQRHLDDASHRKMLQFLENGMTRTELADRLRHRAEGFVYHLPAIKLTGFTLFQHAAYGLMFLVFLLATGGEHQWSTLITHPSGSNVMVLVLSIINTLFSDTGLAALGTLLLLNCFLAFRFHRRYKKVLRQRAQKIIESLEAELMDAWGQAWNELNGQLSKVYDQVSQRLQSVTALQARKKGP